MFSISLQMEVSPNFLITKRMINNTAFSIVSAVLGSIAGILAVFGKAMRSWKALL